MSDAFTGAGLSIEPVYGARSFDVDPLGRLNAVSYDHVWRPGENVASCQLEDDYVAAHVMAAPPALRGKPIPSAAPLRPWPQRAAKHSPATCSCGFYSYFSNSDDYHSPYRVNGVVEGYGETVIGSRGFRSQKARIVALHIPGAAVERFRGPWHRLHRFVYDSDAGFPLALFPILAGTCLGVGAAIGDFPSAMLALAVLLAVIGLTFLAAEFGSWRCNCTRRENRRGRSALEADLAAKIRRNYDGIPVYDRFEDMVAAHPLTPPAEPQPSDADFWTRGAS